MTDDLPRNRDAAVEALFRMHGPALLQVAWLLIGDETAAQDVVLDAFADLRVRGRYRDSYAAVDHLRSAVVRGARRRELPPDEVLASLNRRQRESFVLSWWPGLSVDDIGELLRLSRRSVAKALTEARRLLPSDAELSALLEARADAVELSYEAPEELQERICVRARRRRRRVGLLAAVAVLVFGAVGGILWLTNPRPYASPTGRPIFAAVVPVAEFATFDVTTGRPRGEARLGSVAGVTSLPAGGWLVSRTQPGCGSVLVRVAPKGSTTEIGATYSGLLSGIEVSPDGRYVAAVVSRCPHSTARDAGLALDVIELRTGRVVNSWSPPAGTTSISGLSWRADSLRLAYTLGTGLGGRGSGFAFVDRTRAGGRLPAVAPTTRNLRVAGSDCQVVRSIWLGASGRFAVFAACVDHNELVLLQVPPRVVPVEQGTVLATVPGSSLTLGLDAAATVDGRHLLVTTDVATFRIDGSRVTRLVAARSSPAW